MSEHSVLKSTSNDTTEKNFTEGSFTNIAYTNSLPIGGGGNDTLQAKISGTLWTAPTVFGLSGNGQMVVDRCGHSYFKTD